MKTKDKLQKLFLIWFTCLFLSFMCFPIHADTNQNTESERFLKWYEENKEVGYSDYTLQGDLYLDTGTKDNPIILDGNGRLTVNCAGYSIYVRSPVVIDNEYLMIYTFSVNGVKKSPVVVENGPSTQALLTLKHGYIGGNTGVPALLIKSGDLQAIDEAPHFTVYGDTNAVEVATDDVTLQNMSIETSDGSGEVIGVKANKNITLKNCNVLMSAQSDAKVTGILAGNDIRIIDSDIQIKADHAVSVRSNAGVGHIYMKNSSLLPELDVPWESDDLYRVVNIHYPIISNIPYGLQEKDLKLPETMRVDLTYLDGREGIITKDIRVDWNTKNLKEMLSDYGEYTIIGKFSSDELEAEHIYIENSYVPKFKFKVISDDVMNELLFSKIEMDVERPFVNVYFYRPYLAQSMILQYSENGIDWIDGYVIRESDQVKDTNLLTASLISKDRELVSVYFPKITKQGRIRAVIKGGVFDGVWNENAMDMENLFTPPGEDGNGGNRGGGGQVETEREIHDEENSGSSQQHGEEQTNTSVSKQKQTQELTSSPISNVSSKKQKTDSMSKDGTVRVVIGISTLIVIIGVCVYTKKKMKHHI